MEKHLKPKQHYVDRYDKVVVERCRWYENAITDENIQKHHKDNLNKKGLKRVKGAFTELALYFVKGEMYQQKDEVIEKWMREEEELDRFCEQAEAPRDIECLTCNREMFVSYSHLETSLEKPPRMLYMYDCTLGHLPRRAFYDNGEEWKREKPRCAKCGSEVEEKDEDTDKMYKTVLTCLSCGHVEVSEVKKTVGTEEKEDSEFEKDRERFCNDKDGREYIEFITTAKEISEWMQKQDEKEKNKELYDRVEKLKKLSVPQIKTHIEEALGDKEYTNLVFEKPNIERIVSIEFSIEDPTDRSEHDSRTQLTRLLKGILEDTNWRLMSDGINYRLGVLTGRVRVYEKEEELVKLVFKSNR